MSKLNPKNAGGRILALVLAVLMLVPIIPVNIFAEGESDVSGHVHTEDCVESRTLTCGYPEEPSSDRELLCKIAEHTHTEACYALHCEEEHEHSEDCYALICGMEAHTHDDICYAPVHQHTEDCYLVTYNCQAEDEPVQTENEPVVLAVDEQASDDTAQNTTKNLGDLLASIAVEGLVADENGHYHVNAQQNYTVNLTFRESDTLEFNMAGSVSFQMPSGIQALDASGQITVGVSSGGTYYPIVHDYTISGNVLTIKWNKDDQDFAKLEAAHFVSIDFHLNVKFDGTKDEVRFGDSSNTIINMDTLGSVTVTKNITGLASGLLTDKDKKAMTFALKDASGNVIETFTYLDMVNGSKTFNNLKPGSYTVVETGHPDFPNYTFDGQDSKTSASGTLAVPGPLNLALRNDYEVDKGSLNLKKAVDWTNWDNTKDMPDNMKSKIEFTITGPNGYRQTVNYAQFQEGKLILPNLPVGEYTVTETNKITGYTWTSKVNSQPGSSASVNISNGEQAAVAFENTYVQKTGSLTVKKTAEGAAVPGSTTFKVTFPDGTVQNITYSQMQSGEYTFENIPLGNYKVEEVRGTGQVEHYTLTVNGEGNQTLTEGHTTTAAIHNRYTPVGSLKINKTILGDLAAANLTSEQKNNIKFEITGPNGYQKKYSYSDFTNGVLSLSDLPLGEYTVRETAADISGYTVVTVPSTKENTVELENAGGQKSVSFTNTYTKEEYKLSVVKQFADGSKYDMSSLPDAIKNGTKFRITAGNNQTVKECTLAKLEETLTELAMSGPGPYTVTEINPNVNGILIYPQVSTDGEHFTGDNRITVSLKDHEPVTVTFKNKYVDAGLIKGDKAVAGLYPFEETELRGKLRFDIYKEDNTLFLSDVTLAELTAGIKVPVGNYYVKEKNNAVPGYTVSASNKVGTNGTATAGDTTAIFQVSANGETVHFTNTYSKDPSGGGTVGITKTVSGLNEADTAAVLGQISFKVEEKRGNAWYEYGTYQLSELVNGSIVLRPGQYRITEQNGTLTGWNLQTAWTVGNNTYTGSSVEFRIEKDTNITITVLNHYYKVGRLEIKKFITGDLTSDKLTDAQKKAIKFTVTGPAGFGTKTFTYWDIRQTGIKIFENIPVGEYTVTETGGGIDQNYTFTVTDNLTDGKATVADGQTATVTFENNYVHKKGNLTVTKTMAGNDDLTEEQKQAMVFQVMRGNTVIASATYQDFTDGAYTFIGLDTGNYTIVETIGDALTNVYQIQIDGSGQSVSITENQTADVTITNTFTKLGSLQLVKTVDGPTPDDIGSSLSFTIACSDPEYSKTVSYSAFTNGTYTIPSLVPGTYTVTEQDATTGYYHTAQVKVNEDTLTEADSTGVTIESGEIATVTFVNTYEEYYKLKIVKDIAGFDFSSLDDDKKAAICAAIQFTVTNENGAVEDTFTYADMIKDGPAVSYTVDNLTAGTYTVTETILNPELFGNYDRETTYVIGTAEVQAGQEAVITLTRGENQVVFTNTYTSVPLLSVEKSSSQTHVGFVEKDGKRYPVWRFTLAISNLNPRTAGGETTTFTDTFDKSHDWFRLATDEEASAVDEDASAVAMISREAEKGAPTAAFEGGKITISGITDETAEKCDLVYYLIVKDEASLAEINQASNSGDGKTGVFHAFNNTVTYSPWPGDPDSGSSNADYEYEFTAVSKDIMNVDDNGNLYDDSTGKYTYVNRAKYSITLNESGATIGDGDTITATDTFSENQTILLTTVKTDPAEGVSYVLDNESHTITFTLPNNTPVKITYETVVNGEGKVALSNDIDLCGFSEGIAEDGVQTSQGAGSATIYSLKLVKTDSRDNSKRLKGAVFGLYDGETREDTPLTTATTDENGLAILETWQNSRKLDSFKLGHPYYFKELTAPVGYQRFEDEIWFKFGGEDDGSIRTLEDGGELIVKNDPITVTLEVTKDFNRWDKQSRFSFHLSPVDDAPMPTEGGELAAASVENHTAAFGSIHLVNGDGAYQYNIRETVEDPLDGILYDLGVHTATVTVKDGQVTVTYDGGKSSLTVTNTYESVEVFGRKTWDDDNDRDRKRPDSITIHLLADGVEIQSKTVTAADNWSWKFTDLPKHKNNGTDEIVYTVAEDPVEGYSSEIRGYNVTNSYTPEKISISGKKLWKDSNNQDGIRPRTITVNLLKNGENIASTTVSGPDWSFTFDDLPKYEDGELIAYTITEQKVRGYTTVITGDAQTGFTITNTHKPRHWGSWFNPRTGDSSTPILWLGMLIFSGMGIFAAMILGKKKGKYQR